MVLKVIGVDPFAQALLVEQDGKRFEVSGETGWRLGSIKLPPENAPGCIQELRSRLFTHLPPHEQPEFESDATLGPQAAIAILTPPAAGRDSTLQLIDWVRSTAAQQRRR